MPLTTIQIQREGDLIKLEWWDYRHVLQASSHGWWEDFCQGSTVRPSGRDGAHLQDRQFLFQCIAAFGNHAGALPEERSLDRRDCLIPSCLYQECILVSPFHADTQSDGGWLPFPPRDLRTLTSWKRGSQWWYFHRKKKKPFASLFFLFPYQSWNIALSHWAAHIHLFIVENTG